MKQRRSLLKSSDEGKLLFSIILNPNLILSSGQDLYNPEAFGASSLGLK